MPPCRGREVRAVRDLREVEPGIEGKEVEDVMVRAVSRQRAWADVAGDATVVRKELDAGRAEVQRAVRQAAVARRELRDEVKAGDRRGHIEVFDDDEQGGRAGGQLAPG